MTDFHERRIHSAFGDLGERTLKSVRGAECGVRLNTEILSAVQKHCPPENHLLFATRYSLLTTRCRFGFNWRVVLPHNRKQIRLLRRAALQFRSRKTEIFRHGRAVLSGKNHLLLSTRHSLLAAVFGSAGASPSHFCPPTEVGGCETEPAIWVARCGLRVED